MAQCLAIASSTRSCGRRLLRNVAWSLAILAAGAALGPATAAANRKGDHCFNRAGVDINERLGMSETIVLPFCPQLRAGEHWTTSTRWFMDYGFTQVPAGFVPAGPTPVDDFRAKFVAVRYVVDAGTRQERSYVFPNSDRLWMGIIDIPPFGELPTVDTATLGVLHPLRTGPHTIDRYWRFSAQHCDGFGTSPVAGENCFPAGETFYSRVEFEVVPASEE
jgi:hypothetical protein